MKKQKMKLSELKVKSFMTQLSGHKIQTVKGGADTTPDPSEPIKDKPIDLPATGVFCPTGGINWCPK